MQSQNDSMYVKASYYKNTVELRWHPFNPDHWDEFNRVGYKVERVELDVNDRPINLSRKILAGGDGLPPMMPKDSTWFVENGHLMDELISVIGILLYDSTFQFPKNELMDANTMRYNYLLHEARFEDLVIEALGLGLKDSALEEGKRYRYTVSGNLSDGSVLSNSIEITAEPGADAEDPEGLRLRYDLPQDISLSQMIDMNSKKRKDKILAKARAYEDSIVIRWGPNNPLFWLDASEKGYYVIRTEGRRSAFGQGDTLAHVLPIPEESLGDWILSDTMAMVAANNLYADAMKGLEGGTFKDQADLFNSRFGFALYAADRSIMAANVLGIRYVDKNVEPGKTYSYTIASEACNEFLGMAQVNVSNFYKPVPGPVEFAAVSGEKAVNLFWSKKANKKRYNSYILERSDDGGETYYPLTDLPIVFLETAEFQFEIYSFADSVESNYVKHKYRLCGLTSFAEKSAYVEVEGMGKDLTPPPQPSILSGQLNDTRDTIHLTWGTPPLPADFVGYQLILGEDIVGHFDTLTGLLPAAQLEYDYVAEFKGDRAHYFSLLSYDTAGNYSRAHEFFVSVPDITAPEPPPTLEGYIEDDGTVHIFWEHSLSEDVLGYYVFYANNPTREFSLLSKELVNENYFTSQIDPKGMNEKLYVTISSIDRTRNRSLPSEVLELQRPDHVPPATPMMGTVTSSDQHLNITWQPSFSKDVTFYFLYRRTYNPPCEWELVDSIPSTEETAYLDTNCKMDLYYEYTIEAKDDADLLSEKAFPIKGKVPFQPELFVVQNLVAKLSKDKKQIVVEWIYQPPEIEGWDSPHSFQLHKSMGKKNVNGIKLLPGDTTTFTDSEIETGTISNYAIQVRFENGKSGQLSPIKSVLVR